MKLRVKFLIIFILITSMYSVPSTNAAPKLENRIIIFDEGHLQHYAYSDFMAAMADLNTVFDTSSVNYEFEVIINKDNFNSSNLQGADLLIISNPGINDDGSDNVDEEPEKAAINDFVKNGGGVFYLSNPVTDNYTISGHAVPLDALMVDGFSGKVLKGRNNVDFDNTSIIVDDFNNDGNITHVYLSSENIQSEILRNEVNPVNQLIYYGAAIDDANTDMYGNTTYQAYPVDNRFEIVEAQFGRTKWFSAENVGTLGGRALIVGSTIMFTNSSYDETKAWIEVEDHKRLFENMIAWLSNITPLNKPLDTVDESYGALFARNLFVGILLSAGLIVVTFYILIRKRTITPSRLFEFKVQRKLSSKSDKTEKKSSTETSTSKKPKSRRKRT